MFETSIITKRLAESALHNEFEPNTSRFMVDGLEYLVLQGFLTRDLKLAVAISKSHKKIISFSLIIGEYAFHLLFGLCLIVHNSI